MSRPRCKYGKVIIHTELDAKIALAIRRARDKGEIDYYVCDAHGVDKHWHLTSQEDRGARVR
jgi:hypothetical protein